MAEWNVEWARDMILNGGRFGPKRVMEQVYRHNCEVFSLWARGLPTGIPGGLGDRKTFLDATKVYRAALDVSSVPECGERMRTWCENEDCVVVAERLIGEGYNPAILNLASRRHPCGGYDSGASAQEETL